MPDTLTITPELQARVWAAATDSEPWQGYRDKCPHGEHTRGHHLSHWHYCTGEVDRKNGNAYPVGITRMHKVKCLPKLDGWDGCGQLLEAMRAKGWEVVIESSDHRDGRKIWEVEFADLFFQREASGTSVDGWADTLPEAVLLAAAKALGVSAQEGGG